MAQNLGIRYLDGNKVALPGRVLGGLGQVIEVGGREYIVNRNRWLGFEGSLYPVEILAGYRWPEQVYFFDQHPAAAGPRAQEEVLGICRGFHWRKLTREVRCWIYPTKRALESLLFQKEPPQISGLWQIDYKPITLPGGERWKLVRKLERLTSVDRVGESTAGGRLLLEAELLPQRIRT